MKPCLNQSTIMQCSTEEFIKVSAKVGFKHVELRVPKVEEYLVSNSKRDLFKLLKKYGVRVVSINSLEFFSLVPKENYEFMLKKAEEIIALCPLANCQTFIAVPSRKTGDLSLEEIQRRTVRRLELLCDLALKQEVDVSFEFIGFPYFSVTTLGQAEEILSQVKRENINLTIDTFHYFLGGSSEEDLKKLLPEKLFMVHLNDTKRKPIAQLGDGSRVLPGEGELDLEGFFQVLKKKKYGGYISLELFNKKLWREEPLEVAHQSWKSITRYL